MRPFLFYRADEASDAIKASAGEPSMQSATYGTPTQFIAGGTNMVDYMKLGVLQPEKLVDITALSKGVHGRIDANASRLRLGALVRMAEAQDHPVIKRDYPVVAETLRLAASQQIRNMASLGGNILQRTRCEYFRETSWSCNKRSPGSGCSALAGVNREHAVLGGSSECIATYHGDLAQALIALDATVEIFGPDGARKIPFAELHLKPGRTPNVENTLRAGELITFIEVPAGAHTRRSHYVKVRDRQSYQFALTAAAVAIDLDGDQVRDVRIALGGVATVPWRAREAEDILKGKALTENSAKEAAEVAFRNAQPREHNAFKVAAGKATVVRALLEAKAMVI